MGEEGSMWGHICLSCIGEAPHKCLHSYLIVFLEITPRNSSAMMLSMLRLLPIVLSSFVSLFSPFYLYPHFVFYLDCKLFGVEIIFLFCVCAMFSPVWSWFMIEAPRHEFSAKSTQHVSRDAGILRLSILILPVKYREEVYFFSGS